ncbi:MAG: alpha/beta hydrolase [Chloroflexota bacterium]|nr:MAG: alpha/beta hydrolase [Chloroflexota bacterium]
MKSKLFVVLAVLVLVGILFPSCAPDEVTVPTPANINPIIFVHGFAGSAAQFESQAMRFASNGYPSSYITACEYDSSPGLSPEFPPEDVLTGIDQFIDTVINDTGAEKVDIVGHSLGTKVSQTYLRSSPERAAKVAHYVNIDGFASADLPGGVPTLALWAGRRPPGFPAAGAIVGATNVTLPNVTHVECATCPAAFVEMFKFLTGQAPATDKILPEPSGKIQLAGRVVIFPQNIGIQEEDSSLQVWEVDGKTGTRITAQPLATYPMEGATGAWGPFDGRSGANYEFCLVRDAFTTHYYFETSIRSDYLIRLSTEAAGGRGLSSHMDTSDRHSNMLIGRGKEFWGDQDAGNDVLTVDGNNVITPETCPLNKLVNVIFVYDNGADSKNDLTAPTPYFYNVMPVFMSGVDIFIPAADPPNRTISVMLTPRGGGGETQVINIPNWISTKHRIGILFNDFIQAE